MDSQWCSYIFIDLSQNFHWNALIVNSFIDLSLIFIHFRCCRAQTQQGKNLGTKLGRTPGTKPSVKPDTKPGTKPGTKPSTKLGMKLGTKHLYGKPCAISYFRVLGAKPPKRPLGTSPGNLWEPPWEFRRGVSEELLSELPSDSVFTLFFQRCWFLETMVSEKSVSLRKKYDSNVAT